MTAPTPNPRTAKAQRPQKGKGKTPKRQDNGFYADHSTGDRLRSVTTIINGGVPKESLIFWAANTCVDATIEALPQLVAASRDTNRLDELRTWLKRAHTRAKDERADIGSAVHKVIEAKILDKPIPQEILDDPNLAPYTANFLRFVDEWQVVFTASEMVVANPEDGWAGTLDYMLLSELIVAALRGLGHEVADGVDLMGDTKTGGTLNRILSWSGHVHGVYPEAGLQMSAYRKAKVCWLKDGSKVPMPATAEVGIVLHLQPDGYQVYPTRCGDDVYAYFRHAQMVDEWSSKIASAKRKDGPTIVGPALKLPRRTTSRKVA